VTQLPTMYKRKPLNQDKEKKGKKRMQSARRLVSLSAVVRSSKSPLWAKLTAALLYLYTPSNQRPHHRSQSTYDPPFVVSPPDYDRRDQGLSATSRPLCLPFVSFC